MTLLIFVSYKFRNTDIGGFNSCYLSNVWVLESPSDFPRLMGELQNGLKEHHKTDVVIIENVTMQKWESND